MRNKLRSCILWWLAALKRWHTSCVSCGALGAYPCSVAACIPMCTGCQMEESIRLENKLYSKATTEANSTGGTEDSSTTK